MDRLRGQHILVTGATGFLAKIFVEKLLRVVPEIGRIYLLVRPRSDGTSAEHRVRREVLGSNAFDRLRAALGPAFERRCDEKIRVVSGDLVLPRLGLSEDDYRALTGQITLVVNSAATVTFDERLDAALRLNVHGPQRLLEFAKDCGNVPLMQVSTAYVSGVQAGDVPEELIPPGHTVATYVAARRGNNVCVKADDQPSRDPERDQGGSVKGAVYAVETGPLPYGRGSDKTLHTRSKTSPTSAGTFDLDATLHNLERRVDEVNARLSKHPSACRQELIDLGMELAHQHGWHDTYTFTKWLAEQMLARDRGDVPLVIFRPAIIEGSYEEPAPGWIDGLRMADPLILAYGRGQLLEFPAEDRVVLDLIPVDFVANAMIATLPVGRRGSSVEVFQCGSGARNPMTIGEMARAVGEAFRHRPMRDEAGRPIRVSEMKVMSRRRFAARWQGRLRRVRQMKRLLKSMKVGSRWRKRLSSAEARIAQLVYFVKIYTPYTHLHCRYLDDRLRAVHDALHPRDRELFPFDVTTIDWREYLVHRHVPGVRHFVLGSGTELEAPMLAADHAVEDEAPDAPPPMQVLSALRGESIFDVFENAALAYPKRIALQVRRNGRWVRYTYADALATTSSIARRFVEHGLRQGDHVAIWADNCPEWGLTYLAAARQGLVVVPFDARLPASEVAALARFADVKLICVGLTKWTENACENADNEPSRDREGAVCAAETGPLPYGRGSDKTSPTRSDLQERLANQGGPVPAVVALDATLVPPPGAARDPGPEHAVVTGDDLASIVFTSGTTVAPRGVMLRHRNFLANARSLVHVQPIHADDQFLSVLPLHHVFEFTDGFLVPVAYASTVTYAEKLTGPEIASLMQATGTTVVMVVPRLLKLFHDGIMREVEESGRLTAVLFRVLRRVADIAGVEAARLIFGRVHRRFGGRVRMFVCGGSSLPVELYHFFRSLGLPVCEGYGLTETAPVLTVNPASGTRAGSVGLPLPEVECDIRNQDASGVGELWVRGPNVMAGYYQCPAATREVIQDGWFRTGDLCRRDADGFLYVTGRVKDLIITAAGKNVYPDEVEVHYADLPHVKELCVLAMPNRDGIGDSVDAVMVLDLDAVPDVDRSAVEDEVRRAVAQISARLPSYQRIANIHFWTCDLPKTSTMKTKRAEVAQRLALHERPESAAGWSDAAAPAAVGPTTANEGWLCDTLSRLTNHEPSRIRPDANLLLDLGIDSLMKIELLGEIEGRFGLSLPEQVASRIGRVGDLHALIANRTPVNGTDGRTAGRRTPASRISRESTWSQKNGRTPAPLLPLRWMMRGGVGAFFHSWIRVESRGLENIPADGPFLLAANHCSHLDSATVLVAVSPAIRRTGRRIYVAGAEDYFFNSRLKALIFGKMFDTIPFDRHSDGVEGLRRCAAVLRQGHAVLLFPEGTRSLTGAVQPFRVGIAALAVETGVPIVPVRIENTFELFRKGHRFVRPGVVRATIGPPIHTDGASKVDSMNSRYAAYRRIVAELQKSVETLRAPIAHV